MVAVLVSSSGSGGRGRQEEYQRWRKKKKKESEPEKKINRRDSERRGSDGGGATAIVDELHRRCTGGARGKSGGYGGGDGWKWIGSTVSRSDTRQRRGWIDASMLIGGGLDEYADAVTDARDGDGGSSNV